MLGVASLEGVKAAAVQRMEQIAAETRQRALEGEWDLPLWLGEVPEQLRQVQAAGSLEALQQVLGFMDAELAQEVPYIYLQQLLEQRAEHVTALKAQLLLFVSAKVDYETRGDSCMDEYDVEAYREYLLQPLRQKLQDVQTFLQLKSVALSIDYQYKYDLAYQYWPEYLEQVLNVKVSND